MTTPEHPERAPALAVDSSRSYPDVAQALTPSPRTPVEADAPAEADNEPSSPISFAETVAHARAVAGSLGEIVTLRARVSQLEATVAELRTALADVVVKSTEYGEQEGGFVAFYLIPTGPLHRAMPLLENMGIVVRPGFDGRVAEPCEWCSGHGCAECATPERPEADALDRSRSTPNASAVSTYPAEHTARLAAEQETERLRAARETMRNVYRGDVERMVRVCAARGYRISATEAQAAWEEYSDTMAAGWMDLGDEGPERDDFVFRMVQFYSPTGEPGPGQGPT